MNRELLLQLRPVGFGDPDPEPFTKYRARVAPNVPNFPDSVIEQWLHRHYDDAVQYYGWLGFEHLRFTLDSWALPRLTNEVTSFKEDNVDRIRHWIRWFDDPIYSQGNWLIERMKATGTWPSPIIVLQNTDNLTLPNTLPLGTPFHLVEGHHRLGFLLAMAQKQVPSLREYHDIWVVCADASHVSHEWPNL